MAEGDAVIKITADSAQLQRDLDAANAKLKVFEAQATGKGSVGAIKEGVNKATGPLRLLMFLFSRLALPAAIIAGVARLTDFIEKAVSATARWQAAQRAAAQEFTDSMQNVGRSIQSPSAALDKLTQDTAKRLKQINDDATEALNDLEQKTLKGAYNRSVTFFGLAPSKEEIEKTAETTAKLAQKASDAARARLKEGEGMIYEHEQIVSAAELATNDVEKVQKEGEARLLAIKIQYLNEYHEYAEKLQKLQTDTTEELNRRANENIKNATLKSNADMLREIQDAQTKAFGVTTSQLHDIGIAATLQQFALLLPTAIRNQGGH